MNDCIFCKIIKGEIPSFKVYEDASVLAYLDINPFTRGHTLVIPKAHTANLVEATPEQVAVLIAAVRKVAAHLRTALPCDGFNILQNNGEAAGQTVHHLHFHIIPRYQGEKLAFEPHKGDMSELAALAARIRLA